MLGVKRESSAVAARLELDDGRTLAWAEYGEPSGRPIVLQHGTPGSLLSGRFLDEAARSRGWRVTAIERAGMGASSPNPASTAISAATDAAALIDALGLGQVVSMGISGGATPAVALAVLRPDLVRGAVLVSGMLPLGDGFAEGVPRAMRVTSRATDAAPWIAKGFYGFALRAAAAAFGRMQGKVVPGHGVRAVMGAHGQLMAEELRRATAQGCGAMVRELRYLHTGGELDWQRATCPIVAVHGDRDKNVPIVVAHNAARLLPTCSVKVLAGRDHYFLPAEPDAVLDAADEVSS
jgi:pimeloyl-ACP methyl ester carboxylesterase